MNLLMMLFTYWFYIKGFLQNKDRNYPTTQKHTDTVQGLILNVLVQNNDKDLDPTIILNCYGIKLISLGHDKFTMMKLSG